MIVKSYIVDNNTVKPVLSKHLGKSQKVVALDRCLPNTGKFILNFHLWDFKKWPLKTGDC